MPEDRCCARVPWSHVVAVQVTGVAGKGPRPGPVTAAAAAAAAVTSGPTPLHTRRQGSTGREH
eukprot:3795160-Prymnesium_polylepis.1